MKTLLISLLLIHLADYSMGQVINPNQDNIRWEYNSFKNSRNNETVSLSGYITSNSSTVTWVQNNGSSEYTMQVTSSQGQWTDATAIGEVIYQVTCNGLNGTVKIFRNQQGLSVQLDFSNGDALTPHLVMNINSYSKI